jgi:hypothetical protein
MQINPQIVSSTKQKIPSGKKPERDLYKNVSGPLSYGERMND